MIKSLILVCLLIGLCYAQPDYNEIEKRLISGLDNCKDIFKIEDIIKTVEMNGKASATECSTGRKFLSCVKDVTSSFAGKELRYGLAEMIKTLPAEIENDINEYCS